MNEKQRLRGNWFGSARTARELQEQLDEAQAALDKLARQYHAMACGCNGEDHFRYYVRQALSP